MASQSRGAEPQAVRSGVRFFGKRGAHQQSPSGASSADSRSLRRCGRCPFVQHLGAALSAAAHRHAQHRDPERVGARLPLAARVTWSIRAHRRAAPGAAAQQHVGHPGEPLRWLRVERHPQPGRLVSARRSVRRGRAHCRGAAAPGAAFAPPVGVSDGEPAEPAGERGSRRVEQERDPREALLPPGRHFPRRPGAPGDAALAQRDGRSENLRRHLGVLPQVSAGTSETSILLIVILAAVEPHCVQRTLLSWPRPPLPPT